MAYRIKNAVLYGCTVFLIASALKRDSDPKYVLKVYLQDNYSITPSVLGRISSYYYLHHASVRMFKDAMSADTSLKDLIDVLSVCVPSSY